MRRKHYNKSGWKKSLTKTTVLLLGTVALISTTIAVCFLISQLG